MSNQHNDAIKEMLFEAAMTSLVSNGAPDNEKTELKAIKIVAQQWENYREGDNYCLIIL